MPEVPQLTPQLAIAGVDGRYWRDVHSVSEYFSNYALNRDRVMVEIEYLIALHVAIGQPFGDREREALRNVYKSFTPADSQKIDEIETQTDHDVKAIEYLLREKTDNLLSQAQLERIHMGLTSEDVTNLAQSTAWKRARSELYVPALRKIEDGTAEFAETYAGLPMLGRTHGRPASPTTVGKEFANYSYRLRDGRHAVESVSIGGKLGGAVGNQNALVAAYPDKDWIAFSSQFVEGLGIKHWPLTTQLLPHDAISRLMREIVGVNQVVLGFDQDMWRYISDDWFVQKVIEGQTGSSTMPQKVNPRHFENSEGNLKMANWIFNGMADDLQVSRLQRDLSDSTIKRNYGLPLAFTLLAYQGTMRNMGRLEVDERAILEALNAHPEILSEAIQTVARREGVPQAYEQMRDFVRGKEVTLADLHAFVDTLSMPEESKQQLKALTPATYLGNAERLTRMFVEGRMQ